MQSQTGIPPKTNEAARNTAMAEKQYLTPAEAAAISGFDRQAIYRAIWDRELKAFKVRGRVKIHLADFYDFMEANPVSANSDVSVRSPTRRQRQPSSFQLIRNRALERGSA